MTHGMNNIKSSVFSMSELITNYRNDLLFFEFDKLY